MTTFADLGLSETALVAVERMGYTDPTPVQEQAIPLVMEGRDLIAAASTGTGKTAAFLLPVLSALPRMKGRARAPRMLVVSPTRELAQQIANTCMQITRQTRHFTTTVFGGTPYGPQIKELRGGTDVLIATPGRLKDLMARGVVDLGGIEVLVLDEADRMLDMGFLPDVTTIVNETPENRQTLLFSATIDHSIQKNLGSLLRDPAIVEVSRNGETAKTVAQFIMPIAHKNKQELLEAVLDEKGSERVIVFARTKHRAEDCADMLCDNGYRAESIHSDKSQGQRRRALENFRRGKTGVLVATDVLARGIDVPEVDHVINLDLPDMPEDYVHRIGRTGRAGEEGYAISFVSRETRGTLRSIERLIGKDIPVMEIETYELDPSLLTKPERSGKGKGKGSGKPYGNSGRPARSGSGRPSGKGYGKPAGRSTADNGYKSEHKGAKTEGKGGRNGELAKKHHEGRVGEARDTRDARKGSEFKPNGSAAPHAKKSDRSYASDNARPARKGKFADERGSSKGESSFRDSHGNRTKNAAAKKSDRSSNGYDYSRFSKEDKQKAADRD
ncbi:DEAD/DEAH box helicase [Gordonibacter sp.]|uniref:DEAD/DEAH box helicase n=1 Tax=Gordonibacter sp. TaxID=1968902 RepID=UPI002FCA7454